MYYAKFDSTGERITTIVQGIHFECTKEPIYNTEDVVEVIGQDPETGEDITKINEPGTVIVGYGEDLFNPPIPEGFIQITKEEQDMYSTGDYIRNEEGKPVKRPVYVPDLAVLKETKWQSMKMKRDILEQSGVPYLGKMLDSDALSVQRIAIAVQAAQAAISAGVSFELEWTMQDNTSIKMTAEQIIGMPMALAQYSNVIHQNSRLVREQIENAETIEELDAIAWPE